MRAQWFPFAGLASLLAMSACADEAAPEATAAQATLRWRVVHQPSDYFVRMALQFEKDVEARSEGRIQVEVYDGDGDLIVDGVEPKPVLGRKGRALLREKLAAEVGGDQAQFDTIVGLERARSWQMMLDGEVDMAQIYTYHLVDGGHAAFRAFELPFAFDDYAHIERFLESSTGEDLLVSMADTDGARGLAYTFSGGLLLMNSRLGTSLAHPSEWSDRTFCFEPSSTRNLTLGQLGAQGHNCGAEAEQGLLKNAEVEEINLPDVVNRLVDGRMGRRDNGVGQAVTETQHVLLSTVVTIREATWDSLSPEDQQIVKEAALSSARFERQLTVDRYAEAKEELRAAGFPLYTLTPEDRAAFRQQTRPAWDAVFAESPEARPVAEVIEQLGHRAGRDTGGAH